MGAVLAEAHLKGKPLPFARRSLLIFPLLFLIFNFIRPLSSFCFTLAALSTACVIAYLLKHPDRIPSPTDRRAFLFNHLSFVGLVSYSLYLIHMPLLTTIDDVTQYLVPDHHFPYLGKFAICATSWFFVLIPAYLFYRFLELPSIALGKRFIEMRRRKEREKGKPSLGPL